MINFTKSHVLEQEKETCGKKIVLHTIGGLANRLVALVSAAVLAYSTNRILQLGTT